MLTKLIIMNQKIIVYKNSNLGFGEAQHIFYILSKLGFKENLTSSFPGGRYVIVTSAQYTMIELEEIENLSKINNVFEFTDFRNFVKAVLEL